MEKYELKKQLDVCSDYDLVVAGGGMGGASAAIAAGRLGLKVLLIEATGCLGGMGTSGLVCSFNPMANGVEMMSRGIMKEITETMYERGQLGPDVTPDDFHTNFRKWIPFMPEGLKTVLDEMTANTGVDVRFFTRVVDADVSNSTVNGVVIANVEGMKYIKAKAFIDGTGDALLANLCNAECKVAGIDSEHIMAPTVTGIMSGIDFDQFNLTDGATGRREQMEIAYNDGVFTQLDRHLAGLFRISEHSGYMNCGHVFGTHPLESKSLSEAMSFGRKILNEYLTFYKKYHKGFDNAEIVATNTLLGVRESRRIVGEYTLNIDDYTNRRHFPDQIAVFNNFIDIHPYDTSLEEYLRFCEESYNRDKSSSMQSGESFGLPYGITVPKGFKNLWVAGRSVSCDVKVQGAMRTMPCISNIGEAAGTAAWLSVTSGKDAAEIDTEQLVTLLRKNGAFLPQKELSPTMTRN